MQKYLSRVVLVTFLFVFKSASYAQSYGSSGTSSGAFFFSAGTGISKGTLEASNLNLDSRSMAVYGLNTTLGMNFGALMVGGALEYNIWAQLKDPADYQGTNAQGKEMAIAPLLGYNFGFFSLAARYYLSSKYTFDKADALGNKLFFSSPNSSMAFDLKIPWGGRSYFGIQYKTMKYQKVDVGGVEKEIESGKELKTSAIGASVGLSF